MLDEVPQTDLRDIKPGRSIPPMARSSVVSGASTTIGDCRAKYLPLPKRPGDTVTGRHAECRGPLRIRVSGDWPGNPLVGHLFRLLERAQKPIKPRLAHIAIR